MARGVNKAIIVGYMGKDPEIRYMPNGTQVATFNVATTESWKDKQTNETKSLTEWHRCQAYSKLAEIIGQYSKQGSQVYVEGKLRTTKYNDKNGVERYVTGIIVRDFQMMGKAPDSQQGANQKTDNHGNKYTAPNSQSGQNDQGPNYDDPNLDDFDDDIPF